MRIRRSTASAFLIVGIIAALCTDAADAVTGVPSAAASGTSGTTRTTTATTGSGSQHDALAAAAHGSYTGKYGTLDFREDGTATFHILNCGYFDRSPAA